jgi:hypothetical protein
MHTLEMAQEFYGGVLGMESTQGLHEGQITVVHSSVP